jgi:hypothetical protein
LQAISYTPLRPSPFFDLFACAVVGNTCATPLLVWPLELGANIVVHSATKFLGGRCDVLGGAEWSGGYGRLVTMAMGFRLTTVIFSALT